MYTYAEALHGCASLVLEGHFRAHLGGLGRLGTSCRTFIGYVCVCARMWAVVAAGKPEIADYPYDFRRLNRFLRDDRQVHTRKKRTAHSGVMMSQSSGGRCGVKLTAGLSQASEFRERAFRDAPVGAVWVR